MIVTCPEGAPLQIVLLSLHGVIRNLEPELGKRTDVESVELITRQVIDDRVSMISMPASLIRRLTNSRRSPMSFAGRLSFVVSSAIARTACWCSGTLFLDESRQLLLA